MARARKLTDELRNIRRRYERAAKSLERRALKSTDTFESAQLAKAAQRAKAEADRYYAKNIKAGAKNAQQAQQMIRQAIKDDRSKLFQASQLNKVSGTIRKQRIAEMLTAGNGGSTIYAAFQRKFEQDHVPYHDRQAYILKYFGVDNMLDAMEAFEAKTGVNPVPDVADPKAEYDMYREGSLVASRRL